MSELTINQGSARRVPPPGPAGWGSFSIWLGSAGDAARDEETGELAITLETGRATARPGDWLIRALGGALHLAREAQ